jgi:hypothetical protein
VDAAAALLDDGNIEATNNRRERELRRLVLGRNYAGLAIMRHFTASPREASVDALRIAA